MARPVEGGYKPPKRQPTSTPPATPGREARQLGVVPSPEVSREELSQHIAQRAQAFSVGTVQNHPLTTARLIHSSIPTHDLRVIARHLDRAWNHVLTQALAAETYRAARAYREEYAGTIAAVQQPATGPTAVETGGVAAPRGGRIQTTGEGESLLETITGGVGAVWDTFVGRPVSAAFQYGGMTLDLLGFDPLREDVSQVVENLEQGVAQIGRAAAIPLAIPEEAISQVLGRETHWSDALKFWDLTKHNPLTTSTMDILGKDLNDPSNERLVSAMDFAYDFAGQIALGRFVGGAGELARTPAEVGGYFSSDSYIGRQLVRPALDKASIIIEKSGTPETAIGNLLAASDNMDPFLARRLVDSYHEGGIPAMQRAFEEFADESNVKVRVTELRTQRDSIRESLSDDPAVLDEQLLQIDRLDRHIEDLSNKQVQTLWPRIASLRGALKGAPSTSWPSQILEQIYGPESAKGLHLTKITDNIREGQIWWSPLDRNRPADFAERTLSDVAKKMRAAGVDFETIAERLGKYTDIRSYGDYYRWRDGIADDLAAVAPANFPPELLDDITHTLRNPEAARSKSEFQATVDIGGREVKVQTKVLETADGKSLPARETQFAGSAPGPQISRLRELSAWTRQIERAYPRLSMPLQAMQNLNRMASAVWKPIVVTIKPKILVAIQLSQAMTSVLLGLKPVGAFTRTMAALWDHGIAVMPGGVPVNVEAVLSSVTEAREASAAMRLVDPREMGQTLLETVSTPTSRVPVPISDFAQRFLAGETTPFENTSVANDIHWELSDMNASRSMRSIALDGVDATLDRMTGTRPLPGAADRIIEADRIIAENTPKTGGAGMEEVAALLDEPNNNFQLQFDAAAREGRLQDLGNGVWVRQVEATGEEIFYAVEDGRVVGVKQVTGGKEGGVFVAPSARGRGLGTSLNLAHFRYDGITIDNVADYLSKQDFTPRGANLARSTVRRLADSGVPISEELTNFYRRDLKPMIDEAYGYDTGVDELRSTLENNERLLDEATGHDPVFRSAVATSKVEVLSEGQLNTQARQIVEIDEQLSALAEASDGGNATIRLQINDRILRLETARTRLEETPASRTIDLGDRQSVTTILLDRAQQGDFRLPSRVYREMPESALTGIDELADRGGIAARVQRFIYRGTRFWNTADIALTRGGMWHQFYTRWHTRFTEIGLSEERASAAAIAKANFETREFLHDVGNKSSLQRFLAADSPFMHAWQRAAWQWFYKIPERIGGGFGLPSAAFGLILEANMLKDLKGLLESVGALKTVTDPDGKKRHVLIVPNPLRLLDWFPGLERIPGEAVIEEPSSIVLPLRILEGEVPGLGPIPGFFLSQASKANIPILKGLNDFFTHDGVFQPEFPAFSLVTRIIEGVTGQTPPWLVGHSKAYQQYIVDRAHDAALRYAFTELADGGTLPPNPDDFSEPAAYEKARDAYWARANALAGEYYHGIMFTSLLGTTVFPASLVPTIQEEQAWKEFLADNGITGERTQANYALIDKYLAQHPESLAFNTSLYDRRSKFPKDNGLQAFRDAIASGDIEVLDPAQYLGALALSQEWEYFNEKKLQLLSRVGLENWAKMKPQQQLRNWGPYVAATGPAWDDFSEFLDANPAARVLYDRYASPYQKAQDQIAEIEAHRQLLVLDGKDPDAMQQRIWDQMAETTPFGETTAAHLTWYRAVPFNEYETKTHAIFDRIDEIRASGDPNTANQLGAQYDALRALNNSYVDGVEAPDGTTYPSPEEFAFTRLPEGEQLRKRTDWAQLPPVWLSSFQYETTYGEKLGKTGREYAKYEEGVQTTFDNGTVGMSTSSNEYDSWTAWRAKALDYGAKKIGGNALDIRKREKDIPIGRLDRAGILPNTVAFDWIVENARLVATRIQAAGFSVTGTSQLAEQQRGYVEGIIDLFRDPNSKYFDPRVDRFWRLQTQATGETNQHALYRDVIWGAEPGFFLPLDYSLENQTARDVR